MGERRNLKSWLDQKLQWEVSPRDTFLWRCLFSISCNICMCVHKCVCVYAFVCEETNMLTFNILILLSNHKELLNEIIAFYLKKESAIVFFSLSYIEFHMIVFNYVWQKIILYLTYFNVSFCKM